MQPAALDPFAPTPFDVGRATVSGAGASLTGIGFARLARLARFAQAPLWSAIVGAQSSLACPAANRGGYPASALALAVDLLAAARTQ